MPTVEELRSQLGKRGLLTDGLKAELEQRLSAAELQGAAEKDAKRVKTAMDAIADEWMCPITQELPIDPVMAEDGKIYERAAIAKWLGEHQRSPSTGAVMGTKLVPSPQVRNTIEHLVRSGAVDADRAAVWEKKIEDEQEAKKLRAAADQGDAHAMYRLGNFYRAGDKGLAQDRVQARAWYERAAELGHVGGMGTFGELLLKGLGGPCVPVLGMFYTTQAAAHGSEAATYLLGKAFTEGRYGLPQDSAQAKRHLRKVVDGECDFNFLTEQANKSLQQLSENLLSFPSE